MTVRSFVESSLRMLGVMTPKSRGAMIEARNGLLLLTELELRQAAGNPYHDEKGQFTSGHSTFDPEKEAITNGLGLGTRPTPQQAQKLHEAYRAIDAMLHDPEIGVQLWSTLSGFTPKGLRQRLEAMETGFSSGMLGGKSSRPITIIAGRPRAAAAKTVDAALAEILVWLRDPEVGPIVEQMVQGAIEKGHWYSDIRTADGAGSGNFGHAGRPGEVGGSADGNGEWKSEGGFEHTGITWKQGTNSEGRPIPIKTSSIEEAAALVLDGKVVELPNVKSAHTLLDKLATMAQEAKAAGKEAKEYDLCGVSVKGTNLFCVESKGPTTVGGKHYPHGIPRVEMPQMGGKPVPGSEASKLTENKDGEVDGADVFINHLQSIGVKTSRESVNAAGLRASQRELVGPKVAGMMSNKNYDPAKKPIFISKDGYVVDGHHRWAAVVGRDAEDGHLGDLNMNVIRVNAPISEVLHLANAWATKFGIQQKSATVKQSKATGLHKR